MKHLLHISSSFDKPELIENIVKGLAVKRYDDHFDRTPIPSPWKSLKSSTVESYVMGTMVLDFEDEQIKMPFTSSFMFVCTKFQYEPYKLKWSLSLS